MIELPGDLNDPMVAIGDLHGQRLELERLVGRLEKWPEWPDCSLVFLGDFVHRGPNVRGTIDHLLGADGGLSAWPLPYPGQVQVTGHERVRRPDADAVRIRMDKSGGFGTLTACLLRSADAGPAFVRVR